MSRAFERRPLSATQVKGLACEFRKAFQRAGSSLSFDEWRKAAVNRATKGRAQGLSSATQGDYKLLCATAALLNGADGEALDHHIADAGNHARQAGHNLKAAMEEGGFRLAYAERIAGDTWGLSVAELDVEQVEQLTHTLRARARAKKATVEMDPDVPTSGPLLAHLTDEELEETDK